MNKISDDQYLRECRTDWNEFAREVFRVKLDPEQQECMYLIQENQRISIKSGHARGKDFLAAVASLCFLYLYYPSKVISSAPTGRQVKSIMMSEISRIHKRAVLTMPGIVQTNKVVIPGYADWFLEGFKSADKDTEAWTGYHSPNIMVVFTEASGIEDETFDAAEGLLTGNSKELLIFNPNRLTGQAYKSTMSKRFVTKTLSCLDAPNVVEKKTIIPGQVDYIWVKDKVEHWCSPITKEESQTEYHDFEFGGLWYRPNDLFRVKVLGEFPKESEDQVIPLAWIEAANERWRRWNEERWVLNASLRLGVDVAGMGNDSTVLCKRYGDVVVGMDQYVKSDHMNTAGIIKNELHHDQAKEMEKMWAFVDTIGEGAGVHSRLCEMEQNSISVKFSESAKGLTDSTGERSFANMKAFLFWCIRDALDPKLDGKLALPPNEELTEELTEIRVKKLRSDGSILLEEKDELKKRIGRSPDWADSLAMTYYPYETDLTGSYAWIGEER